MFNESLMPGAAADASLQTLKLYLGDGAVYSSAEWCVGTVHMPSARSRVWGTAAEASLG